MPSSLVMNFCLVLTTYMRSLIPSVTPKAPTTWHGLVELKLEQAAPTALMILLLNRPDINLYLLRFEEYLFLSILTRLLLMSSTYVIPD